MEVHLHVPHLHRSHVHHPTHAVGSTWDGIYTCKSPSQTFSRQMRSTYEAPVRLWRLWLLFHKQLHVSLECGCDVHERVKIRDTPLLFRHTSKHPTLVFARLVTFEAKLHRPCKHARWRRFSFHGLDFRRGCSKDVQPVQLQTLKYRSTSASIPWSALQNNVILVDHFAMHLFGSVYLIFQRQS